MKYSAPLDGIRAIAILAVLAFHVSPKHLRGGFTGVDVFFVLSGFLITSIILHDVRDGSFCLREFYARRVRRLLPNAVLTVLAVLMLSNILFMPSVCNQVGRHSLYALTNVSNFFIWRNFGGYWGDAASNAPLLHTWSLAVEEQFYVVFPVALAFLAGQRRSRLSVWLSATAIASFALCVYATPRHAAAAFYLLPTRVWELLFGAVLGVHKTPLRSDAPPARRMTGVLPEMVGWLGVALIIAGFFLIDERHFPGVSALAPTVGTLLVIAAVSDAALLKRLLSTPFMVRTGRLSYSLYLWHWPLIIFGQAIATERGLPAYVGAVGGAAVGFAFAWAAYRFVEQPLRSRGAGRQWPLAVIACGFVCVFVAAAAEANRPNRLFSRFDPPEFNGVLYNVGRSDGRAAEAIRYRDVRFLVVPERTAEAWRTGGIVHHFGPGTPEVAVIGSSHALMYSKLIDGLCERMGIPVGFLPMDGVPAFFHAVVDPGILSPSDAAEFDRIRQDRLRSWHPHVLFVIDRWDSYFRDGEHFDEELRSFLQEVSPLAYEVVFVAQVPVTDTGGDSVNIRELMAWRMEKSSTAALPRVFPDHNEGRRERAVAVAEALTAEFPNLRVLRPDRVFYLNDGSIRWASGRTVYYADDDHLSDAGAELTRSLFEGVISSANGTRPAIHRTRP